MLEIMVMVGLLIVGVLILPFVCYAMGRYFEFVMDWLHVK